MVMAHARWLWWLDVFEYLPRLLDFGKDSLAKAQSKDTVMTFRNHCSFLGDHTGSCLVGLLGCCCFFLPGCFARIFFRPCRPHHALLLEPSRLMLLHARPITPSGLVGGVQFCSCRLLRAPLPRPSLLFEWPLLSWPPSWRLCVRVRDRLLRAPLPQPSLLFRASFAFLAALLASLRSRL